MKIPNEQILSALREWEQSEHTEASDFALCDAINKLHEETPTKEGTDGAYTEVIEDQKREIEELTRSRDDVYHELEGNKTHINQLSEVNDNLIKKNLNLIKELETLKAETTQQQETLMHNEVELIELRDEVKKFKASSEKIFTEKEIQELQSEVYILTGEGKVMMLFNKLLGINAG